MLTYIPSAGWPASAWPAVAALVIFLAIVPFLRNHKYPRAPGPFLARYSNIWLAKKMAEGSFEKTNIALHRKHGKIVRVGPSSYSISDRDALRTIYGHGTQFPKSEWYDSWGFQDTHSESNVFAIRNMKTHSNARRLYAGLYAMSSLVGYEPYVNNCIEILCNKLRETEKSGSRLDLSKWFQYYAFDVIGEITFSNRFGFLSAGEDVCNLIATISRIFEVFQFFGLFKPLLLLMPYMNYIGLNKGMHYLGSFAGARVKEVQNAIYHGHGETEKVQGAPDFCSKLLAMKEAQDPKKAGPSPEALVMGACISNIIAGSDTTSISMMATFYNIMTHPSVLTTLREELGNAESKGELSDPPTFAESQKLSYFQAVLKESLRMHPAVGYPLWREVPAGGATICGTYFPAGTNVGVNAWVMHRDRDIWGADADEFRPERWLESSAEKLSIMNACFMPFGLGSRTCLGKHISLLEISKVIPQLIRKFDMTPVGEDAKGQGLKSKTAWFVKQTSFVVDVKERQTA